MFLLCLLAGCSISWFNTVCFVTCIKNFPANRPLALSLSISFNGVSAALYNLIVNAVNSSDHALYLLLNAVIPLIASVIVLVPILQQPHPETVSHDSVHRDSIIFICLVILAAFTGVYILVLDAVSSSASVASGAILIGALLLLILPLIATRIFCAWEWAQRTSYSSIRLKYPSFNLVDVEDLDIRKKLMEVDASNSPFGCNSYNRKEKEGCCESLFLKDRLSVIGEEHSATFLIRRLDFWLYYLAYFFGGTIGIVYSNNLGQIAQSLGYGSEISSFVSLYSACSFFGRLLSAAPDFLGE